MDDRLALRPGPRGSLADHPLPSDDARNHDAPRHGDGAGPRHHAGLGNHARAVHGAVAVPVSDQGSRVSWSMCTYRMWKRKKQNIIVMLHLREYLFIEPKDRHEKKQYEETIIRAEQILSIRRAE